MDHTQQIPILDHGYLRFIEDWGHGDAETPEAGIIEAARQSTQGSFRGWEDKVCERCRGSGKLPIPSAPEHDRLGMAEGPCPDCNGKGYLPGDARLLKFLFSGKPQHATPFEFCGMVIEVQAPIMVFREWHRHRTQSYNEMSARYAPLPDLNYIPTVERLMMVSKTNKQAGAIKDSEELWERNALEFQLALRDNYRCDQILYETSLRMGVPKELARLVLPVGRYSRMRACTNLRNWLAFLTLRADPAAQWEIQQFANAVGTIIAERFPRTWNLFCEARVK